MVYSFYCIFVSSSLVLLQVEVEYIYIDNMFDFSINIYLCCVVESYIYYVYILTLCVLRFFSGHLVATTKSFEF